MLKQILVPLDGSDLAERALPAAIELAAATGATLHLVRALEPLPSPWVLEGGYIPGDTYTELTDKDRRTASAYLEAVGARTAAKGVSVQLAEPAGEVSSLLLDYEQAQAIDLVVLCSHGRTGLARFALGSVAERLLRHGVAPVLLVRAFGAEPDFTRAIVPLDGSASAEEALDEVWEFASRLLREVTLLQVITKQEEGPAAELYLESVATRLRAAHLSCTVRVTLGDPAHEVLAAAAETVPVIMATHGRSGTTRWAVGSVADRVAHGSAAAVLLVRMGANRKSR